MKQKSPLKAAVTIVMFFLANNISNAQKIEGEALTKLQVARIPQAYKSPTGAIEGKASKRSNNADDLWFVFSDREGNQTYSDKNCTKALSKVNFMEAFVVAEETDDAARLVAYDGSNQPFDEKSGKAIFKATAEDKGWIKKKNLLLWRTSLVNDSTKYSMKALSVKRLDEGGSLKNLIKKGVLDLFNYPTEDKQYDKGNDIHLFQYLFVYKVNPESKMYLLSKTNRTTPSTINDDVIGWAPEDQIKVWDNALCLRTNFDDAAKEERMQKKIDVKFFRSADQAKKFRDGIKTENLPFLYSDPTVEGGQKDNPYFYGFPIIGIVGTEKNIYKTGYVTNTVDGNGTKVFESRQQARYNQVYEELQQQKEKINIVLVLDGASRTFMKTIAEALNDNALIGSKDLTRNDYKLGAIVYNAPGCGDEPFKLFQLNSNKDNFVERIIAESRKVPPCTMNRETDGAPIYDAIKRACDLFGDAKSTNIIVMTGLVSDKDKTLRDAAAKALIDKQVKSYFYQTASKDGSIFDRYVTDCKFFLENTAQSIDMKYFKEDLTSGKRKPAKLVPSDEFYYLQNSGVPGALFVKDKNESFKPEEINKKMKKLLKDIEEQLNNLFARYDQNTVGMKGATASIDEESVKQLMMMFQDGKLPDEVGEILASKENFQLFIEAYASLTTKSLNEPLLNRTLFMNHNEFDRLMTSFEDLNESYMASSQRDKLINSYKTIILQYKGGDIELKTLDGYDLNDFMTLVTSLPPNSNKLFHKDLRDLSNPKKTPDEEIQKLKQYFSNFYNRLKDLKKNHNYRMEQDDETFYWIPERTFNIEE